MSTDFVFDGTKEGGLYNETDAPNPLSYYALTKHKAELMIQNSDLQYLICRTAVLYGWNQWKLNFVTWILEQLKNNNQLSIVTDQINSPTYIENLANVILKLVEKDAKGLYHTAGDCALSRYEIAIKTADIFKLNRDLIQPTTGLKQKAPRPENAALDISKLKRLITPEIKILNLTQGLRRMHQIK
jgi:dTDP-4-dehydrorhamnose reductase